MEELEEKIRQRRCRIGIWFFYLFFDIAVIVSCIRDSFFIDLCIQMGLVSLCLTLITFSKRFSNKYQAYMLMFGGVMNSMVGSMHERNFALSMTIAMACTVLFAIFKDEMLVTCQAFMSVLILLFNAFVLKLVPLRTYTDIASFVLSCLVFVVVAVFLRAYLKRQKKTENELRKAAVEAKAAEKAKADFLANMSHEIRTPMNSIIGMCELVLREEQISDEAREYCYYMQNSGKSLLAIINDVLDYSKIESGKMEIVNNPFQVRDILNDLIGMTYARMGEKELELIVKVDPNLPGTLIGDELRIKQVIINLLTNAVKFTEKGAVTLSVALDEQDENTVLHIYVNDTGIGIKKEDMEKLFTSFQQVDTVKNRSVEGTGLGLAISKNLLSCMGGTIDVESEYQKGSSFHCAIPVKIEDRSPIAVLKEKDAIFPIGFVNTEKFSDKRVAELYKELAEEFKREFQVEFQIFKDASLLKNRIEQGGVTHLFVGTSEYREQKEYLDALPKTITIYLIADRRKEVPVSDKIKCIYKPFYSLSVATALNNEKNIQELSAKDRMKVAFTLPDAKVLLVDDNAVNLKVAAGLMKPYQMQVTCVTSGEEALKRVKEKDIDLVFMDHMMPKMDGVETTQKIRQLEGDYFKKLPIVALTANTSAGVEKMFLESGFDDFLAKPIELPILEQILYKWLKSDEELKPDEERDTTLYLDEEKGLHFCAGEMEDYLELLEMFEDAAEEKQTNILHYFSEKDWKNYVVEVHSLKSTAFTLGIEALGELAKQLEFAGKENQIALIEEKNEELIIMYRKAAQLVHEYRMEKE